MAKVLLGIALLNAPIIEPTLELREADAGCSAVLEKETPEQWALMSRKGQKAAHLIIQVQFRRSERILGSLSSSLIPPFFYGKIG
ncbi:MAG: hypothetical protein ABI539_15655 [Acidobacteriota bacterium]